MVPVSPQMIEIVLEPIGDSARPYLVKVVLEDRSRQAVRAEGEADLDLRDKSVQVGEEGAQAEEIRRRFLAGESLGVKVGAPFGRLLFDMPVQGFIEQLEAGRIRRIRRLTYAEVAQDGPKLHFWPLQS